MLLRQKRRVTDGRVEKTTFRPQHKDNVSAGWRTSRWVACELAGCLPRSDYSARRKATRSAFSRSVNRSSTIKLKNSTVSSKVSRRPS